MCVSTFLEAHWEEWGKITWEEAIGVFDFKWRCAEWSVYDIKVPWERFECIMISLLSYGSRGTLISHTDHSEQCRFKSNTSRLYPKTEKCCLRRMYFEVGRHQGTSKSKVSLCIYIYIYIYIYTHTQYFSKSIGSHLLMKGLTTLVISMSTNLNV